MICDAQNILLEVKYISFLYILGICMQEQLFIVRTSASSGTNIDTLAICHRKHQCFKIQKVSAAVDILIIITTTAAKKKSLEHLD